MPHAPATCHADAAGPELALVDPAPGPRGRTRRIVKRVLRYVVAIVVLVLLFTAVDFGEVWRSLAQAQIGWLLVACACSILLQAVIAVRLRLLTDAQGLTLSTWTLFEINLATMFYGLFLPGGNFAGLAVRFFRLGNEGGNIAAAGVALFIDRIVATISLCLVGSVFWLLERPRGTLPIFLVMAGSTVALLLLCWAITADWPLPDRLARLTTRLRLAMQRWRSMPARAHSGVMLLGMLSHVVGIVVFVALTWSLGIDVGFVSLGWVRSAVILATMIPISVAGLGLREGAMIAMLAAYGIDQPQALAMSLLVLGVVSVLPGLIGGAFEAHRLLLRPAAGPGS